MRKLRQFLLITSLLLAVVTSVGFVASFFVHFGASYTLGQKNDNARYTVVLGRGRLVWLSSGIKMTPMTGGQYPVQLLDVDVAGLAFYYSSNADYLDSSAPWFGQHPGLWPGQSGVGTGSTMIHSWRWNWIIPAMVLPVLFLIGPVIWLIFRSRGPKPGHCWSCGYDLQGTASGVCPECGVVQDQNPSLARSPACR